MHRYHHFWLYYAKHVPWTLLLTRKAHFNAFSKAFPLQMCLFHCIVIRHTQQIMRATINAHNMDCKLLHSHQLPGVLSVLIKSGPDCTLSSALHPLSSGSSQLKWVLSNVQYCILRFALLHPILQNAQAILLVLPDWWPRSQLEFSRVSFLLSSSVNITSPILRFHGTNPVGCLQLSRTNGFRTGATSYSSM